MSFKNVWYSAQKTVSNHLKYKLTWNEPYRKISVIRIFGRMAYKRVGLICPGRINKRCKKRFE